MCVCEFIKWQCHRITWTNNFWIYKALIHLFNHYDSCISYAPIKYAVWSFITIVTIRGAYEELFLVRSRIIVSTAATWTNRLLDSYLPGSFVVVIVGGQIDVFMDAVQQPQEELQSIVLGITTELRSILGHYSLERGKAHLMKVEFFYSCIIKTVWLIMCISL